MQSNHGMYWAPYDLDGRRKLTLERPLIQTAYFLSNLACTLLAWKTVTGYATRPKLITCLVLLKKYIVVYALGSEYECSEWNRSRSYVILCMRQALFTLRFCRIPYWNLPDQTDSDTIPLSNSYRLCHLVRRMRGIERAVKYSFFSTS